MTINGTSHFVSRLAACRYYREYGCTIRDVGDKIAAGEIHIGAPVAKAGEVVTIIANENRYAIVTA